MARQRQRRENEPKSLPRKFGAHMSIAGGCDRAVRAAQAVELRRPFSSSPRTTTSGTPRRYRPSTSRPFDSPSTRRESSTRWPTPRI